ncbi:unnamed protein product [Prunus armeniaca]
MDIAWLCGGCVGVLGLKWYKHDAEVKAWFWGEIASCLFLDDVQGFRMAKAWCFLAEGVGSSWQLWKIGFLMQEDEALVAMALIEFDWFCC